MKRLLIAFGVAVSIAAAGAYPALWASLEGLEAGDGIDGKSLEGAVKFDAAEEGVDASKVQVYSGDAFTPEGTADKTGALAPTIYPNEVASQDAGEKYLSVDTGATELSFDVSPYTAAMLEDGSETVYIDTLVQFTASDYAPEVKTSGTGCDRISVWMKGVPEDGSSGPKLMVTAGYLYNYGDKCSVKNYELNADVEEGKWYRLTIKAITHYLYRDEESYSGLGFQIYLNGELLSSTEQALSNELLNEPIVSDYFDPVWRSHVEARTIFPSLPIGDMVQVSDRFNNKIRAEKVVLKGEGKIDNFALTDSSLFDLDEVPTYPFAFQYSEPDFAAVEIIIGTSDYEAPRLYRENDNVSFTFAARPGHILTDVQVGTPIVPVGGTIPDITVDEGGFETRWCLAMPGNDVTVPLNFTYVDAFWVRKSESGGAAITAVDGGALDLSKQIASGTAMSFKVTAPEGSHVSSVTLKVNDGEPNPVNPDNDGVYSFTVTGTTIIDAVAEVDAPLEVLVTPGLPGEVYATQADALAAKGIARVQPDDAAALKVTDLAAYDGLFEIDVVDNGNGTYSLRATLTAETVAEIVASLESALAEANVADAVNDAGWIKIDPSIAGLYYALKEGSVLGNFKVSAVTIGDGGEVRFDLLNKGDTGFYKINVTAEAQEVEE